MSHYGNTAKDNLHRTIMGALDGFLHDTDKDSEIADMTAEDRLDFIRESIVGKDILYWLCEMSAVKAVESHSEKMAELRNLHEKEMAEAAKADEAAKDAKKDATDIPVDNEHKPKVGYVVQVRIQSNKDPFPKYDPDYSGVTNTDFILCQGIVWKNKSPWTCGDIGVIVRETARSAAWACNSYMEFLADEINRRGEKQGRYLNARVIHSAIFKWDCVAHKATECVYVAHGDRFYFDGKGEIDEKQKYVEGFNT